MNFVYIKPLFNLDVANRLRKDMQKRSNLLMIILTGIHGTDRKRLQFGKEKTNSIKILKQIIKDKHLKGGVHKLYLVVVFFVFCFSPLLLSLLCYKNFFVK